MKTKFDAYVGDVLLQKVITTPSGDEQETTEIQSIMLDGEFTKDDLEQIIKLFDAGPAGKSARLVIDAG